jgi:hypothetical protein
MEMVSTDLILEYLHGIDFPKNRDEVVNYARSMNAPGDVVEILTRLPDQQFSSAAEITIAVGQAE